MAILDTFPQLINFDPKVYDYFAEQFTLCGYNLTFSYPETHGHFPPFGFQGNGNSLQRVKKASQKLKELTLLLADAERQGHDLPKLALEKRQGNKYPVPALTGKINSWYGCWLVEEVLDFAHNYTIPWRASVLLFADLRLTRRLYFQRAGWTLVSCHLFINPGLTFPRRSMICQMLLAQRLWMIPLAISIVRINVHASLL